VVFSRCPNTYINTLKPTVYFMYHQVKHSQNSTFCPHSVFTCFVSVSEQTVIISLYNINWQVFITETVCVYCAVRTESSHIIQTNLNVYTAEARIQPQVSPHQICGWQSGNVTGPSTSTSVAFRQYNSTISPHLSPLHIVLSERQKSEAWKPSKKKAMLSPKSGSIVNKSRHNCTQSLS
jgi:hypothetical protein